MHLSTIFHHIWRGLWCLIIMSLSTTFQLYRGGNRSTQRKPLLCHQSLTNLITCNVSSTPRLSGIQTHNVRGDGHWLHIGSYKSNYVSYDHEHDVNPTTIWSQRPLQVCHHGNYMFSYYSKKIVFWKSSDCLYVELYSCFISGFVFCFIFIPSLLKIMLTWQTFYKTWLDILSLYKNIIKIFMA